MFSMLLLLFLKKGSTVCIFIHLCSIKFCSINIRSKILHLTSFSPWLFLIAFTVYLKAIECNGSLPLYPLIRLFEENMIRLSSAIMEYKKCNISFFLLAQALLDTQQVNCPPH